MNAIISVLKAFKSSINAFNREMDY